MKLCILLSVYHVSLQLFILQFFYLNFLFVHDLIIELFSPFSFVHLRKVCGWRGSICVYQVLFYFPVSILILTPFTNPSVSIHFKGTVSVISSGMSDLQQNPLNLNLIKDFVGILIYTAGTQEPRNRANVQGVPINMGIQWRIRHRLCYELAL